VGAVHSIIRDGVGRPARPAMSAMLPIVLQNSLLCCAERGF